MPHTRPPHRHPDRNAAPGLCQISNPLPFLGSISRPQALILAPLETFMSTRSCVNAALIVASTTFGLIASASLSKTTRFISTHNYHSRQVYRSSVWYLLTLISAVLANTRWVLRIACRLFPLPPPAWGWA